MRIFKESLLLLSFCWLSQASASTLNQGVLKTTDTGVILSKWKELATALQLDEWTWDEARAEVMLAMFDSGNSFLGKYRSYVYVEPRQMNLSQQMNRVRIAEAASLNALVLYVDYMEKRWRSQLNLEQEAKFEKIRKEMATLLDDFFSRFEAREIEFAKPISQHVVFQLTSVLRVNAEGRLKQYNMGNSPGQFRYEPGVEPDSLIKYVGAKAFATCNFEAVTSDMKRDLPPFDQEYVDQIEEVRCLGRKDDESGNPVLGPNCKRTITQDELKIATLGYETSGPLKGIQNHISRTRQYGFLDYLRVSIIDTIGDYDSITYAWSLRPFMNHWRPASAMRSGSGHQISLWTVEPNWEYRHPSNYCEPEYPSGIATAAATENALYESIIAEDPRNAGQGRDVTKIDGELTALEWKGSYKQNGEERVVSETVKNLDQLENAAADARVLSGGHFRRSVVDGVRLGNRIGKQIWQNGFLALINSENDRGGSFLTLDGAFRHCAH